MGTDMLSEMWGLHCAMEITVFRPVTPCNLAESCQHLRGKCCFSGMGNCLLKTFPLLPVPSTCHWEMSLRRANTLSFVLALHSLHPRHIPQSAHSSTTKMDAAESSKTLFSVCQTTRHHIPEHSTLQHDTDVGSLELSAEFGLVAADNLYYLPLLRQLLRLCPLRIHPAKHYSNKVSISIWGQLNPSQEQF